MIYLRRYVLVGCGLAVFALFVQHIITTNYILKIDDHQKYLALNMDNIGQEGSEGNKYSILLPTYNEIDNLPIIVWLIVKYMNKRLIIFNK